MPLARVITPDLQAIIDLDSTVNTVHGHQEGSTVGYNPRYHGRASFQPLFAFEGNSKAAIHTVLRSGTSPSAAEIIEFYRHAKESLPKGITLGYVRGDRWFSSNEFFHCLEQDEVGYTMKLRLTAHLRKRLEYGVLWERIYQNDDVAIEVGGIKVRLSSWSKSRRVVIVRTTEFVNYGQLRLLDLWDYQAIVTNLDWSPEDIWHSYNKRATCQNFIKELKYGLNIDAISKHDFLANYADLWLEVICYNILLAMKHHIPEEYRDCSVSKLQKMMFWIPALVVKYARSIKLRLPKWWPYRIVWQQIRSAIET